MNARFGLVLAILPFVVPACSDEEPPVVSGGAQFTLRNAAAVDNPAKLGPCLDSAIGQQTVAQRDTEGNLKLVVNGADDAQVACAYSATAFTVKVSRSTASFAANGPLTTDKAQCDAAAAIAYPNPLTRPAYLACAPAATVLTATASNGWRTRDKTCMIFFTTYADKRLRGTVYCPLLEHGSVPNACALSPEGDAMTQSFFSFANCSGL